MLRLTRPSAPHCGGVPSGVVGSTSRMLDRRWAAQVSTDPFGGAVSGTNRPDSEEVFSYEIRTWRMDTGT